MAESINVFISYSHCDSNLCKQLEAHLSPLKRSGLINPWYDRAINAGTEWKETIDTHLETSQLILLLISPDFVNSEYCYSIEMKRAMERYQTGDARVIPIILRPVLWMNTPFGGLQALPTGAIPVFSSHWHTVDEAFLDIAEGIQKAVEELRVKTQVKTHTANVQEDKTFHIDNPFTFGKPISDPEHFFGRRDEIGLVLSRLRQHGSSSLVGERRVGRTSILNYINHPNVRQSQRFDLNRYIFIYLDVQTLGKDVTPVRLWQWLLQEMAQYCLDAEIKQMLESLSQAESIELLTITKFFERMGKNAQYPVFLFDDFELITKNMNFGPDFFYHLRNLATQGPLSLVTSSRRDLGDLCHSEAIRSSPFFNIFGHITIRLFTEEEARYLISHSLNGTGVSFTDNDLDMIFYIAGTHPYFLQVASYFLFEACARNPAVDKYTFLNKKFDEQTSSLLRKYWSVSDDQERIVLIALSLLERQKNERRAIDKEELETLYPHPDQVLMTLENRSLLTLEKEKYGLINAFFGKWIYNEFTNTSVGNQQRYEKWFNFNKRRLSSNILKELEVVLPMIRSEYRDLLITWVDHPRNLIPVAKLLKAVLRVD